MTKRVRVSNQIIDPLHAVLSPTKLKGVEDVIVTSGRSGSKSSAMAINVDTRALQKPSAHIMMRKNHNKIESTIYKESLRAFSRLGLSKRVYKAWKRPFKIQIKQNGSVIYFTGSDNPDDTKGMIDDDFKIETVTVDEVNEFFKMGYDRGKEELDNIKATFVRGNDADNFKMFYMFNPPRNPKEPVMKWLEEKKYIINDDGTKELNPKTLHIHVTYLDVPVEWNGQALLDSALETKRIDEDYYNWLWLGQTVGVKDVIFYMFDEKKHIIDYQGQKLQNIGIGVDYGQMNATTYNAFGIDFKNKRLQGVGSYKHSGRETRQMKTPSEYAEDMLEFIKGIESKTKTRVSFITIDPSATGLAEEIKRVLFNNGYDIPIRKARNDVAEGITRTQVLIRNGALVLDSSMSGAIEEFSLYSYDPKSIERGEEKPIKDNDHDMDGIRYLVMEQYKHMKQIINISEDKE